MISFGMQCPECRMDEIAVRVHHWSDDYVEWTVEGECPICHHTDVHYRSVHLDEMRERISEEIDDYEVGLEDAHYDSQLDEYMDREREL